MKTLLRKVTRFLKDDDGPTAIEYAFILVLIVVVCLTAIMILGKDTAGSFQNSNDQMNGAMGGAP
jgi:pilus assembly protein Flp/PilA